MKRFARFRVGCRPRIGFRPRNAVAYRAFNVAIAAFILMVSLPLLSAIALLLLLTQGREIFYRGPRLGQNQREFHILKFRTLCTKRAKEITRDRTLPRDANITTPLGRVLRETRLDELPQVVNILLGDMNICGPRPVRPEIAAIERARIPNYDVRFRVKPGLIGPTQAYFSHGASKRVRARMNNMLVRRPVSITAELVLVVRIGLSVLAKTAQNIAQSVLGTRSNTDAARRRDIWLARENDDRLWAVESVGMRRIEVRGLACDMDAEPAVLYIRLRSGALRKARVILSRTQTFGIFSYSAETEFGEFIIERYALGLVVVPPAVGASKASGKHVRDLEKAWA